MKIVGLMSGTSHDGIDVAAAGFTRSGDTLWLEPLGAVEVPYDPALREAIIAALPPNEVTAARICALDTELGTAYARAAAQGVAQLCGGTADLVVSHGQTVYHWVEDGRARGTLQLGRPAWIAARTGLPVVSDLRSADIAGGGQGAPLVPMFDVLLLEPADHRPRAALNLGGIANMTVVRAGAPALGYDLGPGNALIDAAMLELFGKPYDAGGIQASAGRVRQGLLDALLAEPYYAAAPPKSTGKEVFHWRYLADRIAAANAMDPVAAPVSPADVVATVTELTARVVAAGCAAHAVTEVLASGGGIHNPVLMDRIAELTGPRCAIRTIDSLGVSSDAKEAYAFAVLGWLTWHGLPGVVTSATGARRAAVLGSLTPGAGTPLRLPPPAAAAPRRLAVRPPATGATAARRPARSGRSGP